ncbi:MAG: 3-ketosteroid 9alpha-monooxygenase subunit [Mycobacterium sp.]|jgi:3-ketosteroid 9alpha-monooxygenase subunit B|nr:3-ketosteroid 9alpha-monooxygenase subunit [Mycobacterium sp.]
MFTPARLDGDLLLIAGGSGITPMLSITKAGLVEGQGRIVLVYANRDPESVIFASQLRGLVAQHPDRLTIIHWLETVQGLPDESTLAALMQPYTQHDPFICGPTPFMKSARQALERLGVARSRIHTENFVSLSADPFTDAPTVASAVANSNDDEGGDPSRLILGLNGQTHTLRWSRKDTLSTCSSTTASMRRTCAREGIAAPVSAS